MSVPKVSIIVPVYNVKEYLRMCIESIQNQTFKDIEIIIVNDGSTDGSSELLEKIKCFDDRIIVINKENGGLSSARNAGLEVAQGDYIAFIDSDDWINPEYVKKMYDICIMYKCDIVQCSHIDVVDGEISNNVRKRQYSVPTIYTGKEFSYAMHTLLLWQSNLVWNKLYRKELFQDICFPVGKIHEDEFTTYKLVWNARKIGVISDRLYYYRHRFGSITQQLYSKKNLDASEAFLEMTSFYNKVGEEELAFLTRERHMDWVSKQISIVQDLNIEDKNEILKYLNQMDVNLRKELLPWMFNKKIKRIKGGVFPFSKVQFGSSIILYGGGDLGRQYYRQIFLENYCDVVLWVDQNVDKCRSQGIPVESIERISSCKEKWDYFVIAIESPVIASDVMRMLIDKYGVSIEKIII